jgi:uncharacterized iron-regulated membrane protein
MTPKKLIQKLHLVLGFASGLVVLVVSLTGSLLVFEHELEEAVAYDRFFVQSPGTGRLPADALLARVRAAYPGRRVSGFEMDANPRKTIRVQLDEPRTVVFVNPYSGQLQGEQAYDARFFTTVLKLHRYLLAKETGKAVTGISCVVFVLMLLSGVVLWWPRNAAFLRERLRIRVKARWRRVNYDMHSVAGFYAAFPLLVIALTGLVWSYKPVNQAIFLLLDGKPQDKSKPVSVRMGETPGEWTYETLVAQTHAQYAFPGDLTVTLPKDDSASVVVAKEDLSAALPNVVSFLYFDQYSGKLLKAEPYATVSRGMKVRRAVYPIHTGSVGGLFTKVIALLVSLFAASLPVTGFLIWWGRRKKSTQTVASTGRVPQNRRPKKVASPRPEPV